MLTITDATKAAFLGDSVPKTVTISFPNRNIAFTNTDIVSESMELTESIETESNLTFKGCNASQLKFKVADVVTDLRGEYVEVFIQADQTEVLPLFKGYVDSQSNLTYEDVVTEIVAYDAIYTYGQKDVTDWYKNLTFPKTVKQFRDAFFTQIGITQETTALVNDNQNLVKVTTDNQLIALDVMRDICQINGVYGQIGRDGKFHYRALNVITVGLYPSTTTYPSSTTYPSGENSQVIMDRQNYISADYEPFDTDKINRVVILKQDGTTGGSKGSGTNVFVLQDNVISYGLENKGSAATNLYNKLNQMWYKPSSIDTIGMPYVECGDIFMFNTRKNIVRAYVLQRTLKGIQALFDTFDAPGETKREAYKETTKTQASVQEKKTQTNTTNIASNATRISNIEADYVKTSTLEANYVKTEQLDAVSARVGTIETDYLKSTDISTFSLAATQITSGTISASRMSTSFSNVDTEFTAKKVGIYTSLSASGADVSAGTLTVTNVGGKSGNITCRSVTVAGYDLSLLPVTINGTSYHFLGYQG